MRPSCPIDSLLRARPDSHAHFMAYYNTEHRHSRIAMLTPAEVHAGTGSDQLAQRHAIRYAAFESHPERFVNGQPKRQSLPEAVWINPPSDNLSAA